MIRDVNKDPILLDSLKSLLLPREDSPKPKTLAINLKRGGFWAVNKLTSTIHVSHKDSMTRALTILKVKFKDDLVHQK